MKRIDATTPDRSQSDRRTAGWIEVAQNSSPKLPIGAALSAGIQPSPHRPKPLPARSRTPLAETGFR
jgi:hypothetical protein